MAGKRQTLVVRIWQDDNTGVRGQVIDPVNDVRRPFNAASELWQILLDQLRQTAEAHWVAHEIVDEGDSMQENR